MTWITHNWRIKAGSLLIASLLFAYVQYSRTVTRVLNIRVDRPEIPADMVLSSRIPVFMNVKVYGPRELMEFNVNEFRIVLSNPSPETGENTYRTQLSPELPEGISAVFNREVRITLEKKMIRELPVIPDLDLNLPEGFRAGYRTVTPPTFRVSGPRTAVMQMEKIRTERIFVNTLSSVYRSRALITGLPDFVKIEPGQSFDAEVSLQIVPERIRSSNDPVAEQDLVFLEEIPVRCRNDIKGITMRVLADRKVSVVIMRKPGAPVLPVTGDQFQAEVFCPVFFSNDEKRIMPWDTIMNLPVYITDKLARTDLIVLDTDPPRLSLQFEKTVVKQPDGMVQGLQEHLIR